MKTTTTTKQDAFTQEAFRDLNRMLDEEMAKPENERDYEKITDLSRACYAVLWDEEEGKKFVEESFRKTEKKLFGPKITMHKRIRVAAAAASAAAVLVGANVFTVTAYNMNLFSALVKITDGSFALNPQPQETVELTVTVADPYGIKAECAKYGITEILAPTYLPEGFVLGRVYQENTEGYLNSIFFTFYDTERNSIQVYYNQWDNESLHGNTPCDNYNLTETTIDGNPAIISKEDGQYVLVFRNDTNLETKFWMEGVDYGECDRIIASLE